MKILHVFMFGFAMLNSVQAQWKQEYIDSLDTVFFPVKLQMTPYKSVIAFMTQNHQKNDH